MEQMNTMLAVPPVSTSTPVSTTKTILPANQESFASVYERNISESSTTTTKETKVEERKTPQSEVQQDEDSKLSSESKTESGEATGTTDATEVTDPSMPSGIAWQTILDVLPVPAEMLQVEAEIAVEGMENSIVETGNLLSVETTEIPVVKPMADQPILRTVIPTDEVDATEILPTTQTTASVTKSIETPSTDNKVVSDTTKVVEATNKVSEQTKEVEKVTVPIQNIDAKVQTIKTANETVTLPNGTGTTIPQSTKESILDQIQQNLGKITKSGDNEIRLQLSPENLGMLNIRIIAGKEGTQVLFKTDNLQSSQLITGQIDTLKAMLSDAGIKVDQVLVSDFSFSQQGFANQEQTNQQTFRPYTKTSLLTSELTEQRENVYELPQSLVGLNYLA
jgi:flagellar hook-length control protein FliK